MTKSQKGAIWFAGTLLLTALGYKFAALSVITNAHIVVALGVSAGYIAAAYVAYQSLKLLWQFATQKRKTIEPQIIAQPNPSPVPQDKNHSNIQDDKPLVPAAAPQNKNHALAPAPVPQDRNRTQDVQDDKPLLAVPAAPQFEMPGPIDDGLNELNRLLLLDGHPDSDPDDVEGLSDSLPGEDSDLGSTTASPIVPRHRHYRDVVEQPQRLGTREIVPVERLNIGSHKGQTYEGQVYIYPLKRNRH